MNLTPYPENSYTPPQAPGFMPGVSQNPQTANQLKRPATPEQTPPPRLASGPVFWPAVTEKPRLSRPTKFGLELSRRAGTLIAMTKQIPNILTFSRIVLTVIFLAMILCSHRVSPENYSFFLDVAFVIFVVAGLTDLADGRIARWLGVTSKLGRMLDPLADKVLVCGSFVCFAVIGEPVLFHLSGPAQALINWTVAAILIVREGCVTALRHYYEAKGIDFSAVASGKIKMVIQSFAIGTVLVKAAHVPTATWGSYFTAVTFAIMLIVTVVSGFYATRRIKKHPESAK